MNVGNRKSEGLRLSPLGRLCKERGITQTQLSRKTGLNRQHIHQLIYGTVDPQGKTLIRLADALGVTTDYLLGR